jgi:hypothetical protein
VGTGVVNRARGGVKASPWVESLVWPQGNKGFAYMYTSIVTLENEAPLWQPPRAHETHIERVTG